jgi:hypothetical protein
MKNLIALIISFFALTGCLQMRSYVDPNLPQVSYSDIHVNDNSKAMVLKFEFRRNGKPHALATKQVLPQIIRTFNASRLFSSVSSSGSSDLAHFDIVMDNVADTGGAFGKGLGTGFTFGAVGSMVTDGYTFTATYTAPGKNPVTKAYSHALHSTVGNAKGPEGLEPMSVQQALDTVIEQLVLNLLRDLQKESLL